MFKFKSTIKRFIDNNTISKIQKALINESYMIYKSSGFRKIDTMWIVPNLSRIDGYDSELYRKAKSELINLGKFSSTLNTNGTEFLTISDDLLKDMEYDILPTKAFIKKYRSEIISIFSLLIALISMIISIVTLSIK
ncbi:MAG: hypothetical protein HFJ47_01635 [Clostridia bacterium]|nr:hypothetical protein [Clostridia bacterium]